MNVATELRARTPDERLAGIIKLAVMAVGGQGGGVLTSWIENLARAQGYAAQATSVAGVAQRTGATIYYIEMAPKEAGQPEPVFSLAPASGDVDILIAAEMMEAGRAIIRGFVTPDRTTLIASTHRALAVSEKMTPGDGIADADEVRAAAEIAAQRVIMADMEQAAVSQGSVISASLFGALAGSGALPFDRAAFEEAIRASGKGVEASLRAFGAGFEAAQNPENEIAESAPQPVQVTQGVRGPKHAMRKWEAMVARVEAMPAPVAEMALPGLRKVVNFQDVDYGAAYLDKLDTVLARDHAENGHQLSHEAAKYIANAMAYDDVIRVADLKTRARRFDRIRAEMGAGDAQVLQLTEFMHPRAEEVAGMLPARLGAKIEDSPKWMARLDRWFNKGRRLRTDSLRAFIMLYILGGMKGWRLKTRRHALEMDHLDRWLDTAMAHLPDRYGMAVEIIRCRRLIKGYSDTHARGLSKFDRVLEGAALVAHREDGPDWVARLREAALQDEKGDALEGALKTVRSFSG
ncbi:indolepyruvate oxidoreductase subunit beta family protein [Lutimaribacter sp. EGI FJ00015]|uniref:Indolepyruvate oxidoreductase subunit beta family protein n=1 Tax=Lutimaribacter degradans TaxID=2945989 RepID=A0ACC5ZXT0_9RHOB|nr:indolepyruvate oxidoreductase subunit beta family protein [Lutimaribacter sp. EGI FJ00013]MCM2562876.1 indolepyruvate oxidoreductase subunit beta family protein [Lutimaribacter sp. EGI FJ00013]MCO0614033.1 indolepyruvate oxidoreductase subunit beta family protein [Lutimaribacter sp. EGI FJ00015]MCO0637005.1 indolepyruvate oxidoreductase subunit beta family protein [Lutimaribacter sp. EGI FJ00014]